MSTEIKRGGRFHGSKESEMMQRHRQRMDALPQTTRCAFCDWTYQGTVAEGKEASLEHRRELHPDNVVFKRRRRTVAGDPGHGKAMIVRSEDDRLNREEAMKKVDKIMEARKKVPLSEVWTKQRILERLARYAAEHDGVAPKSKEWEGPTTEDRPNWFHVQKMFGSWSAALVEAGLVPRHGPGAKFSDDEILDALRAFHAKHGRPVGQDDCGKEGVPSRSVIKRRFGSFRKANVKAGVLDAADVPELAAGEELCTECGLNPQSTMPTIKYVGLCNDCRANRLKETRERRGPEAAEDPAPWLKEDEPVTASYAGTASFEIRDPAPLFKEDVSVDASEARLNANVPDVIVALARIHGLTFGAVVSIAVEVHRIAGEALGIE